MVPVTRTGSGTKDMAAIMERVRRMSDSQLADVLAGKDVSIPQFAAMTEAMGRKQLRQAVDGAQAQQQAQQPSVKEQLLAEQQAPAAGLDALPAPNMESIDMAGGGIIAFDEGGGVMDRIRDFFYAQGEFAPERNRMSGSYKGDEPLQGEGITGLYRKRQEEKRAKKADIDEQLRLNKLQPEGFGEPIVTSGEDPYGIARTRTMDELKGPGVSEPPVVAPSAAPAAAPSAGLPAINVGAATKFERRASPFGQMSAEKVDFEGLKDKGLGEGLMKMGAGLLSAPGSKGFAAGIQALAESGAVSRKEINALKKDARDYDLNVKKADAAFEQGNDELGFKYMQDANLNKYRIASLNQKPGELRTLEAIAANPQLAAIYKGGKGAGVVSRTDALKEWNDLAPNDKRKLQGMGVSDFNSYYSYLSTGLPGGVISDTLPKDAKVRS
jgi:hypothetical protein